MFRALLTSGVLFQGLKADLSARMNRAVVLAVCGIIALIFCFAGLLGLGVALAILLAPHTGPAWAAAIVGGGAIVLGLIVLAVGMNRGARRSVAQSNAAPFGAGAIPGVPDMSKSIAEAPVPWLLGAVLLGIMLGKR